MPSTHHQGVTASSITLTVVAFISLLSPTMALSATTQVGCFSSSNGMTFQGTYQYQSQGYCQQQCVNANQPVMGLTNGGDCWCGNLTPPTDSKVSDSQCSAKCNGYGQQSCGGDGAWGVFLTGTQASVGSAQDSSKSNGNSNNNGDNNNSNPPPAPVSSAAPEDSPAPAPVVSTIVSEGPPVTETLAPSTVTASGVSTTLPPSVVTVGGAVTQVVTLPASTANVPNAGAQQVGSNTPSPSAESHHTGTGTKVGVAVGVVVAVLAVAGAAGLGVFFCMKRKNAQKEATAAGAGSLDRNNTINSLSTNGGFAGSGAAPGAWAMSNDSRLDPGMVETRRGSIGSVFDDSEDYSRRVLKVTNPSNR